jgi:hypothetical protein
MKIQLSSPSVQKIACTLLVGACLLSSCGTENKPAAETANVADTTQSAAPAGTANSATAVLTKFDFEHFGSYDLSTWTKMETTGEGGGDVEIEVLAFEKDGQKLEIEEYYKGEYGYDLWYRLTGADGKVQKIRTLEFSNEPFAVTETVNDYTVKPAKKYSRTQETGKHYSQLDPLPTAATGAWAEGPADEL